MTHRRFAAGLAGVTAAGARLAVFQVGVAVVVAFGLGLMMQIP